MQKHIDEFRQSNVDVVVVTQSQPKAVAGINIALTIVCDPERTAYRYFGLDRGTWSMFFRWSVLRRYLSLIFSGWRPRSGEMGEDMLQLGGDFIVSADLRLLYTHRSTDPADRPTVRELVDRLKQLAFTKGHGL